MGTDTTPRHTIHTADYGTDPITIAQKIAQWVNAENAWIVLRGPVMTAASVARHLHLFHAKEFRHPRPRGVCVDDGGRAYVHWDSHGILAKGSVLP